MIVEELMFDVISKILLYSKDGLEILGNRHVGAIT